MGAETRASFGGRLVAILAAAGSAIGLGSIWRFPYVAGENGGAAFLLVYLLAIFAMFASFHRAQQYEELQQKVVLLREEAIYSIRNRHLESSHSKILERLKESGVDIQDPYSQPKILK